MEIIDSLYGHGRNLNALQMSIRAVTVFFIALVLVRLAGMRVFGIKSAFDVCIVIMLGSVLSRAVVGVSPFVPTIVASTVLMILHKIIARISVSNQSISHLVKGKPISLYKDGILNKENLRKCALSYGDVLQEIRLTLNEDSLDNIDEIFMERTGNISVIQKNKQE